MTIATGGLSGYNAPLIYVARQPKVLLRRGALIMDNSVLARGARHWTTDDIRSRISKSKVVMFAKGSPSQPGDGYSARAFSAMDEIGRPYEMVDVAGDRSIAAALREFAGRMTLPMVFVNGQLITSSETLERMVNSGELRQRVSQAFRP